jgi:alpha-tubulin suppressor-like RCC1 family protein
MRFVLPVTRRLEARLCALVLLVAGHARAQCGAIEVAAGRDFSVAVRADGTAWAWGAPWVRGGAPNFLDLSQPTQVEGLSQVIDVAAGEQHALALHPDGSVSGWGDGTSGQLGPAAAGSWADAPVTVTGLSGVQILAAGRAHSVALLDDGTVVAWGDNSRGQLGDGTFVSSSSPVPVLGLVNIVMIASGADHCLALDDVGAVFAWGAGDAAALGIPSRADAPSPVRVSSLAPMSIIGAGAAHSLAADSTGAVWSWGSNELGQLGHSWLDSNFDPDQVPGVTGVVQLAGGEAFTLALLSNGTVLGWGSNREGDLGSVTPDAHLVPVAIGIAPPLSLAAGAMHSLAVLPDGGIAAWGADSMGELGVPADAWRDAPVQALPAGTSLVALAGSREDQSFSISSSGEITAWGDASRGELGAGLVATFAARPFTIPGVATAQRVASGKDHALVLLSDSTVLAMGRNDDGQLGDGSAAQQADPVPLGLSGITAIAAGSSHSLAVEGGSVLAWGANYAGQLGDGTRTSQPMPALVPGLASIEEIAAGASHSLARDASGRVFAWGANDLGQLGLSDTAPRLSPVEVTAARGAAALACGTNHSLALLPDGSVLAWGDDLHGQLGIAGPQAGLVPVAVPGLPAVSAIAAGDDFSLAMTASGDVFTWGALPPWSATPEVPRRVLGLPVVTAIAAGSHHAFALAAGDAVWAWGANDRGQLGIGTGSVSQSPQDPGFARAVTDFTGTLRARKVAGDAVELRWQSIAPAVTYVVRRDASPTFVSASEVGRVPAPTLTDAPPPASLWCYRVTGVDCSGTEGPP